MKKGLSIVSSLRYGNIPFKMAQEMLRVKGSSWNHAYWVGNIVGNSLHPLQRVVRMSLGGKEFDLRPGWDA